MGSPRPLVMVSANAAWNLAHFRAGLIRALQAGGWRVMAVAPPDPVWSARLEEMGCIVAPWPLDPAGLSPWRDAASLFALLRLMRRHRPAAWLSWTIKPNCYGALAARLAFFAARGNRVLAIPNVSGLGTAFIRRSGLTLVVSLLYRLAFAHCPTVFFQNAEDRDLFVGRGMVRPGQARLLPGSGVDLAHFVPDYAERPRRRFLMVARLLVDKGVREFVAAARVLRAEMPDTDFAIIGEAGAANRTAIPCEELEAWIAEGVIAWHPPVEDIRPAMSAADWIVLPSYREGLSRVLIEAAALGRPCVASDAPGCRQVVSDGANGYLAPPRDAEGLAAALRRAAQLDETGWQAMARANRALAETHYGEQQVIALYREAMTDAGILWPIGVRASHPEDDILGTMPEASS